MSAVEVVTASFSAGYYEPLIMLKVLNPRGSNAPLT